MDTDSDEPMNEPERRRVRTAGGQRRVVRARLFQDDANDQNRYKKGTQLIN